jgi:hypothetical protein
MASQPQARLSPACILGGLPFRLVLALTVFGVVYTTLAQRVLGTPRCFFAGHSRRSRLPCFGALVRMA